MPTLKLLNLKAKLFEMAQDRDDTLVLEATKDEISQCFVEGFNEAIEQFKLVQPDIDKLVFDPFKSVIDGKIVDDK
ncbi:hypothetical protein VNO80_06193 [Phaseolus coccineus]|uniref:Uncharacterized protein n=1 Tax=Phaseolus coccineus TaxID=3886 RepID=A0AAN9NHM7_PHACN